MSLFKEMMMVTMMMMVRMMMVMIFWNISILSFLPIKTRQVIHNNIKWKTIIKMQSRKSNSELKREHLKQNSTPHLRTPTFLLIHSCYKSWTERPGPSSLLKEHRVGGPVEEFMAYKMHHLYPPMNSCAFSLFPISKKRIACTCHCGMCIRVSLK